MSASGGLVRIMTTGSSGDPVRWSHHLAKDVTNLHLFLSVAHSLREQSAVD
ncbi:hypothetical protein [Streptomyces sp. NPDC020362]|uniref:hypothetical protein n=1 Tax=unclassified Streptomyces TaxID=2593676 RepID=UPI000AF865D3